MLTSHMKTMMRKWMLIENKPTVHGSHLLAEPTAHSGEDHAISQG